MKLANQKLSNIFFQFLKLGSIGFGGPIAMLGYLEKNFVRDHPWISLEQFQKFVAVSKLFPGPLATLVSVRIGTHCAGWRGGVLAALGQILPAFFLILGLAVMAQVLPLQSYLGTVFSGLGLAALAISFQATYRLTQPLFGQGGSPHSRIFLLALIMINAGATFFYPRWEAAFIFMSGFITSAMPQIKPGRPREAASIGLIIALFMACFQSSILTFGSGIAVVPVLKTAFLDQHGWLSTEQFLRGLTFAQITPGPLVILSSYLGYEVAGLLGAIAATVGTFAPTVFFGAWLMPNLEEKMLRSPVLKSFFSGLIPAVCGALLGAMLALTQLTISTPAGLNLGKLVVVSGLTWVSIGLNWSVWRLFVLGILGQAILDYGSKSLP